ncbi:hypothetical protein, partial [Salmonella enterica]|uniref:hypothetical protein n=1 Tax=Salmonella enterica TaxID=28901 RepID=UPI0035263CEE
MPPCRAMIGRGGPAVSRSKFASLAPAVDDFATIRPTGGSEQEVSPSQLVDARHLDLEVRN